MTSLATPPRPLRVAMLSYHTSPLAPLGGAYTGGMNVYIRDLSRALVALGVQVDVFTRWTAATTPPVLTDPALGEGNRLVTIPAGPPQPLPRAALPAHVDAFVRGVQAWARRAGARYALLHSHYWLSGLAALTLRAAWRVPVVHMCHTLERLKAQALGRSPDPQRLAGEARCVAEVDRLIVATSGERALLHWLYQVPPAKVAVIPPGVDTAHFRPLPRAQALAAAGLDPTRRWLLFVGRLDPIKGLDTLLQAVARMQQRGVAARHRLAVALVGGEPGPAPAALQARRAALGLDEVVFFLGPRPRAVLPAYYAAAEAVVMPSYYESFGMAALEAMACGTPVVASDVGGLAHLVRHGQTGCLVPPQDPEALAATLTLLLDAPRFRQRLGQTAHGVAQQYAWPQVARRVYRVYRQMLAPAPEDAP